MDRKKLHRASSILPLYILALFLLILSLACSLPGSATKAPAAGVGSNPDDRGPAPTPALAGPVSIGQPFLICDTAVTVLGWENVTPGEMFQPKSGNRFVAAEIVLVNLGKTSVETIWYTFTLLDAYDEKLPEGLFPMMYAHSSALMGGLGVGERTRAKVGYEVPEAEQEFSIEAKCYSMDSPVRGDMIVELGSKPSSVEAPGRFEGEIVSDPLALGKSASVNSVEITVNKVLPFPENLLDPNDPKVATPPDWMEYIIVDLILDNKGTADYEFFATTDLYVQDLEGRRWLAATWVSFVMDEPIKDLMTLKPGDKVSGQQAFQIPKEAGHLYLVFENGFGQAGQKAYFLLS